MSAPYAKLPTWVEFGLIPLINLVVAFLVAGLVVLLVGESPLKAATLLVAEGAAFTGHCMVGPDAAKGGAAPNRVAEKEALPRK